MLLGLSWLGVVLFFCVDITFVKSMYSTNVKQGSIGYNLHL